MARRRSAQPGWGGRYVRVWDDRKTIFDHLTTAADTAEVFGVTEFALPVPDGFSAKNTATMIFDGGVPTSAGVNEGKVMRFRFSPRDAKVWPYVIESDFTPLEWPVAAPSPQCRRLLGNTKTISATHPHLVDR